MTKSFHLPAFTFIIIMKDMSTEAVSSPSLGELVERSLCTSRVPSSRPSQVSGGFCCDEIKSVEIYICKL